MIELQNVSKRFGRRTALDGISLQVERGEVTLLLGANGAGKSTLLRCVLGIGDFEGSIRVSGLDPLTRGREVRALVGYMPQAGGLHPDLTVEDTLHLFADTRTGWSIRVIDAKRGQEDGTGSAIPPFVRADGTNNGAWFHSGALWFQNEDVWRLPDNVLKVTFAELLQRGKRAGP